MQENQNDLKSQKKESSNIAYMWLPTWYMLLIHVGMWNKYVDLQLSYVDMWDNFFSYINILIKSWWNQCKRVLKNQTPFLK